MKNVFITGDSQTAALYKGIEMLAAGNEIPIDIKLVVRPLGAGNLLTAPFFEKSSEKIRIIDPVCKKRIPYFPAEGDPEIYGFCGNVHTIRVLRDIDWSVYAPAPVAKNEHVISSSFLERIFEADQRYMLHFLDTMLELGLKVFVIDAPRPFRHNRIFRETRQDVLLYLDREYRRFILQQLAARKVDLVSNPIDCVDEEGFMKPEFRHPNPKDRHHANEEYGAIMARRIVSYLSTGAVPE